MKKVYLNHRTNESTESGTQAYKWHLDGDLVQVNIYDERGTLADVVHVNGAAQKERDDDAKNLARCKRVALELEAYTDGNVYRCPECNKIICLPDDVGDKYKCPDCGEVHDVDDLEQLGIYDYMDDILDVEFAVNSKKEFRSCSICVGFGGPSIYIDTGTGNVELYWWGHRASYALKSDTLDAVNDWAEEYYNCL